jgi:hypothetical protein
MMHKKRIKTLTIRKLPEEVADAVHKRAEEGGMSFSKALISLLQERLRSGVPKKKKKRDLSYMRTWTQKEYDDFMADLADQRKIDPEMWK